MPSPHDFPEASRRVGFSHNRLDRQSENRDAETLARAQADPQASFIVFIDDRVLVDIAPEPNTVLLSPERSAEFGRDEASTILLGYQEGLPVLACTAAFDIETLPETVKAVDLRSLAGGGSVPSDQVGAVAQGRSFLLWQDSHEFCANCGTKSVMALAGHRRDCPNCGRQHFPRTDPVVIMLAVDSDFCLLGRSPRFYQGMYSCLAGFMEPGETIEDAVRRETFEEAGIRIGEVRYHASQPWPFPSSLMIGCH
ncbi:MAG: NAD(+) diphosphatase, partial [Rhodobiaceae bacterium]|nr:NAD(+) diphosphatase [Rhodobiaceae bacterium]